MRAFAEKTFGITGKNHSFSIKLEPTICLQEALQQPNTEESGTAGKKESVPASFLPKVPSRGTDEIEIFGRKLRHRLLRYEVRLRSQLRHSSCQNLSSPSGQPLNRGCK